MRGSVPPRTPFRSGVTPRRDPRRPGAPAHALPAPIHSARRCHWCLDLCASGPHLRAGVGRAARGPGGPARPGEPGSGLRAAEQPRRQHHQREVIVESESRGRAAALPLARDPPPGTRSRKLGTESASATSGPGATSSPLTARLPARGPRASASRQEAGQRRAETRPRDPERDLPRGEPPIPTPSLKPRRGTGHACSHSKTVPGEGTIY
ncbi:uncharacterized protein LOC144576895 [Callithrix jacchus]